MESSFFSVFVFKHVLIPWCALFSELENKNIMGAKVHKGANHGNLLNPEPKVYLRLGINFW